ncbi:MAG: nucleotidyltransferase family protein [Candidatus Bipolaricaulota bacterium]
MTGVVLAAGAGTRMGRPKLLLPVSGRPLLAWVVDLVNRLPLDKRVIVLGAEAEAIRGALFSPHPRPSPARERPMVPWLCSVAACLRRTLGVGDRPRCYTTSPPSDGEGFLFPPPSDGRGRGGGWRRCPLTLDPLSRRGEGRRALWHVIVNEGWKEGMGSSLRRAAEEAEGGMLVFLGDMPWVPEEAARAVIAQAGDRPVAPAYRGQQGFPVYLPLVLRPALRSLRGDQGARDLLGGCQLVPWPDDGVIRDVDRVEDLHHA